MKLGPKSNCCRHTHKHTHTPMHRRKHTDTNTRLPCATAMMDVSNKGRNQQINTWPGDPKVRRSYGAARVRLCECERHYRANRTLKDQNLSFWVVTSACCRNHTTVITLSSWSGHTRPHRRLWLPAYWLSSATMWAETWPEDLNYFEGREKGYGLLFLFFSFRTGLIASL